MIITPKVYLAYFSFLDNNMQSISIPIGIVPMMKGIEYLVVVAIS